MSENHANFRPRVQQLIRDFYSVFDVRENDLVTLRTLHLQLLALLLKEINLTWAAISQLFKTHTAVHPEITRELLGGGSVDENIVLAQRFVPNEKLVRIVKQSGVQNELLAIDGLYGNLTTGPNFDAKNYIHNLTFARTGAGGNDFDEFPDFKRAHALAVRRLYYELGPEANPSRVYSVLKRVFSVVAQKELPKDVESADESVDDRHVTIYRSLVSDDQIQNLVKSLRWRGEKRSDVEDETARIAKKKR